MDIRVLIFQEVDREWAQMCANRAQAHQAEIDSLKWHIKNLQERMLGFSDAQNHELAKRAEEYREELNSLTKQNTVLQSAIIHIVEEERGKIIRAWVRDEAGLHEAPIPAENQRKDLPMPWLAFTVLDDSRVQMNWMFGFLAGRGSIYMIQGEGKDAHLEYTETLWIS